MSKAQEDKVREYVARKLEIAVDEAAELLEVSMDEAQKILDGMDGYDFTPKAYRGRKDYPNVYHEPLGPDPRDKGDGTRDKGHVLPQNAHLGAFEGQRAMGEESA